MGGGVSRGSATRPVSLCVPLIPVCSAPMVWSSALGPVHLMVTSVSSIPPELGEVSCSCRSAEEVIMTCMEEASVFVNSRQFDRQHK